MTREVKEFKVGMIGHGVTGVRDLLEHIFDGDIESGIRAVAEHDCDNCAAYEKCTLKHKKAKAARIRIADMTEEEITMYKILDAQETEYKELMAKLDALVDKVEKDAQSMWKYIIESRKLDPEVEFHINPDNMTIETEI